MYRYKVAKAGPVTHDEWEAMTTVEKINKYKEVLNLKTDIQVAQSLKVTCSLINQYRNGARRPGPNTLMKLEGVCLQDTHLPLKEYLATHSIAVDPALDVFERAFNGEGTLSLALSCMTLAVKIAATTEQVVEKLTVQNISTCFGTNPAYALLVMTVPGTDLRFDIKVTYMMKPAREYVARVNIWEAATMKQRFAYIMSDNAVMEILTKINKYIMNYVRLSYKR